MSRPVRKTSPAPPNSPVIAPQRACDLLVSVYDGVGKAATENSTFLRVAFAELAEDGTRTVLQAASFVNVNANARHLVLMHLLSPFAEYTWDVTVFSRTHEAGTALVELLPAKYCTRMRVSVETDK